MVLLLGLLCLLHARLGLDPRGTIGGGGHIVVVAAIRYRRHPIPVDGRHAGIVRRLLLLRWQLLLDRRCGLRIPRHLRDPAL